MVDSVGVRELAQRASAVVAEVEAGQRVVVTKHGRPIALILPIDEDEFYDYVLAHAPEYVRGMREAEAELARGQRGMLLDDVLADLDEQADDLDDARGTVQPDA